MEYLKIFFSLKLMSKGTLFTPKFDSRLVNADWVITWQVKQKLHSLASQRGKEAKKKIITPDLRLQSHTQFLLSVELFDRAFLTYAKIHFFVVLIIFRIMTGVELHPRITQSQRANMFGEFFPHSNASSLPSLPRMSIPFYPFAGPYVAIQNRLEIVKVPHEEIWSCVMSPTADGFDIVSRRVITSKFHWRSFCVSFISVVVDDDDLFICL